MSTISQETVELATAMRAAMIAMRSMVNGNAATLAALTTTNRVSLVGAVNELKAAIDGLGGGGGGSAITYSAGEASTVTPSGTIYWPVSLTSSAFS